MLRPRAEALKAGARTTKMAAEVVAEAAAAKEDGSATAKVIAKPPAAAGNGLTMKARAGMATARDTHRQRAERCKAGVRTTKTAVEIGAGVARVAAAKEDGSETAKATARLPGAAGTTADSLTRRW
jgi:hypothetical protein